MSAPTDRLVVQHTCGGTRAVVVVRVSHTEEEVSDLQCLSCGRVLRLQTLVLSADEYASALATAGD